MLFIILQMRKESNKQNITVFMYWRTLQKCFLRKLSRVIFVCMRNEVVFPLSQTLTPHAVPVKQLILRVTPRTPLKLFILLPSAKRCRSIQALTVRLCDSFFPQAIRLLNSRWLKGYEVDSQTGLDCYHPLANTLPQNLIYAQFLHA